MRELESSIYEVLLGYADISDAIAQTEHGFRVVPSHPDLAGAQVEMNDLENRDYRLKNAIQAINADYDVGAYRLRPRSQRTNGECIGLRPVKC